VAAPVRRVLSRSAASPEYCSNPEEYLFSRMQTIWMLLLFLEKNILILLAVWD
jgi:hypothetical protein